MKKMNFTFLVAGMLLFATQIMAQLPGNVPTSGLVGYWPLNGNTNDVSGNNNNGVNNGATPTTDHDGVSNNAYYFNGSSYINVTNNAVFNFGSSDYTVSAWAMRSGSNPFQQVVCKTMNSPTYKGWGIRFENNYIAFASGSHNDGTWHSNGDAASSTINNDQWYHMVGVFSPSTNTVKLYVNGVLVTTNASAVSTFNSDNTNDLTFGVYQPGGAPSGPEFLTGKIDEIGLWNRALTQQEITDLYNGCQLSVNTQPTNQTINVNNNAQFVVSSSDPGSTYQWQTDLGVGYQNLNSVGQYSGTTNDTLTVANVTLSNNNQPFRCIISSGSCSDTSNVAVLTVNNNVGINETSQDKLFSVFPNPAQSVINVKADSKIIGEIYSIYDNTGRVVLTGKLNSENTTIELGHLSGGVYMFRIGENMRQTFKVIKE